MKAAIAVCPREDAWCNIKLTENTIPLLFNQIILIRWFLCYFYCHQRRDYVELDIITIKIVIIFVQHTNMNIYIN